MNSASGGIPVEVDVCSNSDGDEVQFETDLEAIESLTVNRTSKAAFAVSKHEREELFILRKQMMELRNHLQRKGVSMVDIEKEMIEDTSRFNAGL